MEALLEMNSKERERLKVLVLFPAMVGELSKNNNTSLKLDLGSEARANEAKRISELNDDLIRERPISASSVKLPSKERFGHWITIAEDCYREATETLTNNP